MLNTSDNINMSLALLKGPNKFFKVFFYNIDYLVLIPSLDYLLHYRYLSKKS